MRSTTAVFLAWAFLCSTVFGQDAPVAAAAPEGIAWEADFAKTFQQAKAQNRPILVAFLLRGEVANEEICESHLQDPQIVAESRSFLCLLSLGRLAGGVESGSDVASGRLIERLRGRVTTDQLAAIEKAARTQLLETEEVSAPQFLFLAPDGKTVLLHHVWALPKEELLAKMQRAHHYSDPSSPPPPSVKEELPALGDLLERCNDNNMVKRREAMQELALKEHPRVIEFLIKQTRAGVDVQRRLEAIRAMGQKGQVKFLAPLHALLKESDFQVRTNVSEALRQIGLVESVPHLAKVLTQERKDNVRSLLIRALAGCGLETKEVVQTLKSLLEKGSETDRMTVLWILADLKPGHELVPLAAKLLRSPSDKVRAFAYYLVGRHKLKECAADLKKRVREERQTAQKACTWALAQLDGTADDSTPNPSSDLSSLMPSAAW